MIIKKNESINNKKNNNNDINENKIVNKFHLKNISFKFKRILKQKTFLPKIQSNNNLIRINNSTLNNSLDEISSMKNSTIKLYSKEKKKLNKNISCPVIKINKSNYNKKLNNMKIKK